MAASRFASVPNISIPRSRFKQPFNHSLTFQHGDLVPIDCFEVLPGDTYKLDLASLIWMSNPIRPLFGNVTCHVNCFFIPMRLVWQYTKEFFGENKSTSGYQTGSYKIPSWKLGYNYTVSGTVSGCPVAGSISHYLGKPIVAANSISSNYQVPVTFLKERAYFEIWNNFYRAQQLQNPVAVSYGGNGTLNVPSNFIGSYNGSQLDFATKPFKVNKEFDYFTAATLYPQYGPAVTLPLGSFAPVVTLPVTSLSEVPASTQTYAKATNAGLKWLITGSNPVLKQVSNSIGIANYDTTNSSSTTAPGGSDKLEPANLAADLSTATAATINQLRYAFAVQKYLERSNFGTRFFEMLQVHYGVTSPDASLQIPQRIGHADFPINVSTVLSTAGAAADATTELGAPGAASCTASKKYMFTHAFTEPGYLMILLSTTHERSYSQGILREDMKVDRYEIYSPEFANLGDQEIKNCEIFYGNDAYNLDMFGCQEHWAEYRYRAHRVSGMLDPVANVDAQGNIIPSPWVLTDHYATRPSLDGNWIQEDRDWVSYCLVSGANGIDYTGDFYFDYVATREMPLFTIPGLIDHFGSY